MKVDHVHFYVENAVQWRNWFVDKMGFQSLVSTTNYHTCTEIVKHGVVIFVLSSPLAKISPVAQFLNFHPPGVADIAFEVNNLSLAMDRVKSGGAKIIGSLQQKQFEEGWIRWIKISSFGDMCHTLIERHGIIPETLPLWEGKCTRLPTQTIHTTELNYRAIDHLVLNVAAGDLAPTINWYEKILGFQPQQSFEIKTNRSGLYSQVMVHPDSGVKLPINEPTSANSQIQEFLNLNQGAGIQHIALETNQITKITTQLRQTGVSFLSVPQTYYQQIKPRLAKLNLSTAEWEMLQQQEILIDNWQNSNQEWNKNMPLLLQIFTQPIFKEATFFFELIERRWQAQGFGEGNFQALFEAIELEQAKRGSLS